MRKQKSKSVAAKVMSKLREANQPIAHTPIWKEAKAAIPNLTRKEFRVAKKEYWEIVEGLEILAEVFRKWKILCAGNIVRKVFPWSIARAMDLLADIVEYIRRPQEEKDRLFGKARDGLKKILETKRKIGK